MNIDSHSRTTIIDFSISLTIEKSEYGGSIKKIYPIYPRLVSIPFYREIFSPYIVLYPTVSSVSNKLGFEESLIPWKQPKLMKILEEGIPNKPQNIKNSTSDSLGQQGLAKLIIIIIKNGGN